MRPDRRKVFIAGLRLYPLPGNPVLEYDHGEDNTRAVMLLSTEPEEIAALERAWSSIRAFLPGSKIEEALRAMASRVVPLTPLAPPTTNPYIPPLWCPVERVLGWDFDKAKPVIRLIEQPPTSAY